MPFDNRSPFGRSSRSLLRRLKPHSPFATTRARVLLTLWAVLTVVIVGAILAVDLRRALYGISRFGAS